MSEIKTKTLYTMYQIKEAVKNLKYAAIEEFNKRLKIEFEKYISSNMDIQLEIKCWETKSDELNNLFKKYNFKGYRRDFDRDRLKNLIFEGFEEKFNSDRKKIYEQFEVILDKLTRMRKPDAALQFLSLCGIELPEKVEPVVTIPVDPEFIKSVLPKQKMLSEG